MWPQILEAVKNRRRFTWILLSQNAQVVGFDGKTLQIGFPNAGARDSFAGGGSDEVLRQALTDALGVQWQVEALVDPSGGAGGGSGGGPGGPNGPGSGYGAGSGSIGGAGTRGAMAAPAQAGPPQQWSASPPPQTAPGGAGQSAGPASAPAPPTAPVPSPAPEPEASGPPSSPPPAPAPSARVGLEDDMPAEDDPDLDDSALSGHDLIVRELGATVVEEFQHE